MDSKTSLEGLNILKAPASLLILMWIETYRCLVRIKDP